MLLTSQENAKADMATRALREQQVEAGRLIEAIEAALNENGDSLLSAGNAPRSMKEWRLCAGPWKGPIIS